MTGVVMRQRRQQVDKLLRPHEVKIKDWENEEKIRAQDLLWNSDQLGYRKYRAQVGTDVAGLYRQPKEERVLKEDYFSTTKEPTARYLYDCIFKDSKKFDPSAKAKRTTCHVERPLRIVDEKELDPMSENSTYVRWRDITMRTEKRFVCPDKVMKFKYRNGSDGVTFKEHQYTPTNSNFIYILDSGA